MTKPETALAPFAKTMLAEMGYDVRSELMHVDLVGRDADGLFHAVELKKNFGLDVINQGLRSQTWAGLASIVVPAPNKNGHKKTQEWKRLCLRLDIGLYVVEGLSQGNEEATIRLIAPPKRIHNGRIKKSLEKEFSGRSEDLNVGGSTGVVLYTAYTEKACKIARYFLDQCLTSGINTALLSRNVAEKVGITATRTNNILYSNVFGWYQRGGRGCYSLDGSHILDDKSLDKIEKVTGPIDRERLRLILKRN